MLNKPKCFINPPYICPNETIVISGLEKINVFEVFSTKKVYIGDVCFMFCRIIFIKVDFAKKTLLPSKEANCVEIRFSIEE